MLVQGLVIAVVIVWLLSRQMQPKPVRSSVVLPIVLTAIGGATAAQVAPSMSLADQSLLIGSLALGAAIAAVRAYTVRLRVAENGVVTAQGTPATIALWIVSIGSHILIDVVSGQQTTILLYVGIVLLTQTLLVQFRARDLGRAAKDLVSA